MYFFNKFGHCSTYASFWLLLFIVAIFCARSQLSAKLQIASIGHYVYIDVYFDICVAKDDVVRRSDYTVHSIALNYKMISEWW
jgi:hypothetical protein